MKGLLFLVGLAVLLAAGPLRADDDMPPILKEAGIVQRPGSQVPLDLTFRDEAGREVRLGDCCADKPTILVLAYFRCPMLCTQVLNGLVEGLRGVPFTIGNEFNVVTVSFDAREKPGLAAAKKASYVEEYGRPGAEAGWHFLTGEQPAIDQLADAVGFHFQYDPRQDQFAHASGIMLLTPQGQVSRYLLGITYLPRDLRMGLVEASEGKIGSPVDAVLLFCYHYDPVTGQYTPAIMNLVRAAGAVTVLLLVGGFALALWRERRQLRRQKAEGRKQKAEGSGCLPSAFCFLPSGEEPQ